MAEKVSDELWEQIEPLLPPEPGPSPKDGRPRVSQRSTLTGIHLRAENGDSLAGSALRVEVRQRQYLLASFCFADAAVGVVAAPRPSAVNSWKVGGDQSGASGYRQRQRPRFFAGGSHGAESDESGLSRL